MKGNVCVCVARRARGDACHSRVARQIACGFFSSSSAKQSQFWTEGHFLRLSASSGRGMSGREDCERPWIAVMSSSNRNLRQVFSSSALLAYSLLPVWSNCGSAWISDYWRTSPRSYSCHFHRYLMWPAIVFSSLLAVSQAAKVLPSFVFCHFPQLIYIRALLQFCWD